MYLHIAASSTGIQGCRDHPDECVDPQEDQHAHLVADEDFVGPCGLLRLEVSRLEVSDDHAAVSNEDDLGVACEVEVRDEGERIGR